jgi:hypothetical protein
MLKIILYIVLFIIFIFVLIRYIELRSIFYPSKTVSVTPRNIDLDFEDIFFRTEDNVLLNGWFVVRKNAKATVILCHGNAGNISHRLEKILIFHHLGLNTFIFDYRGYGNSQGHPTECGIYLDAQAAYDYLLARNSIDKEAIVCFGSSLGGAIAIDLSTQRKTAALIVDSTFTSAKDMGKVVYPFIPSFVYSSRLDSVNKVKNLDIPKLFIHSINDEIVPFELGEKLFYAAAPPKEFLRVSGGHNTAFIESRHLIIEKLKAFLGELDLI